MGAKAIQSARRHQEPLSDDRAPLRSPIVKRSQKADADPDLSSIDDWQAQRNVAPTPLTIASPKGIYPYFDTVRVWLKRPLSQAQIDKLRPLCGWVGSRNNEAWFDPSFKQWLQLNQPSEKALVRLADRHDVAFNYAEVTLDLVFDDAAETDAAWRFVDAHFVKGRHRRQAVHIVKGVTRYTAPRSAPNSLAIYGDRPSKITGEAHCLRVEWRIQGRAALVRAGLDSFEKLLAFDAGEFWSSRLKFFGVDPVKLGRAVNNWRNGTRRQHELITRSASGFENRVDYRTGCLILRAYPCVQDLVDDLGSQINVRRCLIPLPADRILPRPPTCGLLI